MSSSFARNFSKCSFRSSAVIVSDSLATNILQELLALACFSSCDSGTLKENEKIINWGEIRSVNMYIVVDGSFT